MVLVENLGDGLSSEYVAINISKDVKFIDEIEKKLETMNEIKIKAWGKAISLAVRLALQVVEKEALDFKIDLVRIGTEPDVEIPKTRFPDDKENDEGAAGKNEPGGQPRVKRAMSWIEIALKKK
nr:hypothetical protein [Candidatus Sigynarchaeota archaeon]